MSVRILIKRKSSIDKTPELLNLLRQLRFGTMKQSGYISGETLHRIDVPDEKLVISTWKSLDAWKKWFTSVERSEIQSQIDVLIGEPTLYEIYQY